MQQEPEMLKMCIRDRVKCSLEHTMIFPASHYVVSQEKINEDCLNIEKELDERVKYLKGEDKLIRCV